MADLWLCMFGVASLVEIAVSSIGAIGTGARIVASVFLAIWADNELLRGVNP